MSKGNFEPRPEHKFTFGLWTVGNRGADPFGSQVRAKMSPVQIVEMLAEIGAYGVNDMVLEQFIQLYQQKLLLLKQLQDEINKMNNRAHRYPEIQRKSPSYLKM